MHMELNNQLLLGRKGRAILFCGAGFSADCLAFSSDESIGTGARLTKLLDQKLDDMGKPSGYSKLQNAGTAASQELGEHGLMQFLKDSLCHSKHIGGHG